MKKIIVFSLLLTMSATSFSQQTNSLPALTKQDYLQKSKKQKTAAWILVGGGAAFTITGIVILANSFEDTFYGVDLTTGRVSKGSTVGSVFTLAGVAAMLGSIPLFIASHRNKKKGMSLSLKIETAPQLQKCSFVNQSIPSLSLKISL